jgi:hypothetical protein
MKGVLDSGKNGPIYRKRRAEAKALITHKNICKGSRALARRPRDDDGPESQLGAKVRKSGSAFIVFIYGKVPHEDTDRVIEPLQQKGYRFVMVLQAKVTEPGAFPPKEF